MDPRQWGRGLKKRVPVPAEVLALVEERLGGKVCEECRALGLVTPADEPIELDHREALARGGDNHHLNLTFRCRSHNRAKAGRLPGAPRAPRWLRRR